MHFIQVVISRIASSASFSSSPCGGRTRLHPTPTDHLYCMGLFTAIPNLLGTMASCPEDLWLSIRPASQIVDGFKVTDLDLSIFSHSFSLRAPRRRVDSLAPRNTPFLRASLLVCLPLVLLSQYPLPCPLWFGVVGNVAGDGAKVPVSSSFFQSAGLALFRSITVLLLYPVPSCCRCFTLRTLSAWFFWLKVVFCGTGWASTSIDNFWPCFTIFYFQATTCSLQQHMLQATKSNWLSILVANPIIYCYTFHSLQHLPTHEAGRS